MISIIEKAVKKKKEIILFDLYLKDYNHSNFYFAIVYSSKINKYKVLFVPLDAYNEKEKIEEYFCYQFIFVDTVNYLIELLNEKKYLLENENLSLSEKYDIESHINLNSIHTCFHFHKVIDSNYSFFFDFITVIFEHSPHIVSELCQELLVSFY